MVSKEDIAQMKKDINDVKENITEVNINVVKTTFLPWCHSFYCHNNLLVYYIGRSTRIFSKKINVICFIDIPVVRKTCLFFLLGYKYNFNTNR